MSLLKWKISQCDLKALKEVSCNATANFKKGWKGKEEMKKEKKSYEKEI